MSDLRVRPAVPEDWSRMEASFVAAGKAAWPHILPAEFLERLSPPARWREAISDPSYRVLVGLDEGQVCGFAVLRHSGDEDAETSTGELDSFYVHPDAWGKGVGRELLRAAVEGLREMGFRTATLWTAELNHRPRRVYEAAGWALDGARRERALGGQNFVELRYRRPL
ncbi:MAG TPA: GNAT family N-acetyltransferase [Fimbriimonadaceae bacterium]|nr:GNAT family N-acetyltransferase [Fimbriimonadaceae bacterium]